MAKNEWLDWLKCNVLEAVILIVVLVLLVKGFSAPAAIEVSETLAVEGSAEVLPEETPVGAVTVEVPTEEIPEEVSAEEVEGTPPE
ncbi:MAG: hypothetical protein AABW48_00450 [Nanoarchaeota archaeon]